MKTFTIRQYDSERGEWLYFNLQNQCIWQKDMTGECMFLADKGDAVYQAWVESIPSCAEIIEMEETT